MKLFNKELPCGCQQRKEIMFTQGNPGLSELVLVGLPLAVILFMIVKKHYG